MPKIYDPERGGPVRPFEYPEYEPDPHAVYSLTLREIVTDGFDVFGDPDWETAGWPIDESDPDGWLNQTRTRVERKLVRHFWNAEIEPRVPAVWRYNLTTTAQLVVPKYRVMYESWSGMNPLAATDTYQKNRRVFSEFPAAQINKEVSDYASSADDYESERVELGDVQEKMAAMRSYNDIDAQLVLEFERNFSQLLTMTIGGM